MLFYLTTIGLAKLLREDPLVAPKGQQGMEVTNAIGAWNHLEFLCQNYILNGLSNTLYLFSNKEIAKTLCESLNRFRRQPALGLQDGYFCMKCDYQEASSLVK